MLDVIVHAAQCQVNEDWEFDRQMFRGHTDTRFGTLLAAADVDLFANLLSAGRPETESVRLAATLFVITHGAFGKSGGGCFLTSALEVAKRFVEEMDFIGHDVEAVFKLGCDVCRADDAGDEVEVARHLVNFILGSSPARLEAVRAVVGRMVEDLTIQPALALQR